MFKYFMLDKVFDFFTGKRKAKEERKEEEREKKEEGENSPELKAINDEIDSYRRKSDIGNSLKTIGEVYFFTTGLLCLFAAPIVTIPCAGLGLLCDYARKKGKKNSTAELDSLYKKKESILGKIKEEEAAKKAKDKKEPEAEKDKEGPDAEKAKAVPDAKKGKDGPEAEKGKRPEAAEGAKPGVAPAGLDSLLGIPGAAGKPGSKTGTPGATKPASDADDKELSPEEKRMLEMLLGMGDKSPSTGERTPDEMRRPTMRMGRPAEGMRRPAPRSGSRRVYDRESDFEDYGRGYDRPRRYLTPEEEARLYDYLFGLDYRRPRYRMRPYDYEEDYEYGLGMRPCMPCYERPSRVYASRRVPARPVYRPVRYAYREEYADDVFLDGMMGRASIRNPHFYCCPCCPCRLCNNNRRGVIYESRFGRPSAIVGPIEEVYIDDTSSFVPVRTLMR